MTHLGLGSSFEEAWLGLLGGVEVGLPSREVVLASWEGCVGLCLGGTYYLACLPRGGYGLSLPGWIWRIERSYFSPCVGGEK